MPLDEPEQWLGLPWAKGYEVSSIGRVQSYWKRGRVPALVDFPRLLKPFVNSYGYPVFTIHVSGVQLTPPAHRLVLETFVGPCPEGMLCRHLDGNPQNNCVRNLCWGTALENCEDAKRHGTSTAKLTPDDVRNLRKLVAGGTTQKAMARALGVSASTINNAVYRRSWSHVA